jgi:hypothetical protein
MSNGLGTSSTAMKKTLRHESSPLSGRKERAQGAGARSGRNERAHGAAQVAAERLKEEST